MDDSHLHASSNGQHLQEVDSSSDSSTENSNTSHNSTLNNNKSNNRRLKNGPSLGRLHTQGLSSLRLGGGGSQTLQPPSEAIGGGSSGQYLRADGHVVNPDKLRPTTSALTTSMCSTIEPSDCAAFNWATRIIYRHYSRVDYVRTEAQLDKEAYLIGNIKFSRWVFLPAAFCFQAVCGTLYACKFVYFIVCLGLFPESGGGEGQGEGSEKVDTDSDISILPREQIVEHITVWIIADCLLPRFCLSCLDC